MLVDTWRSSIATYPPAYGIIHSYVQRRIAQPEFGLLELSILRDFLAVLGSHFDLQEQDKRWARPQFREFIRRFGTALDSKTEKDVWAKFVERT